MEDLERKSEPRSDLKSEKTLSAFAAAEWKAVLALDTNEDEEDEGASISCAQASAQVKAFHCDFCQIHTNEGMVFWERERVWTSFKLDIDEDNLILFLFFIF